MTPWGAGRFDDAAAQAVKSAAVFSLNFAGHSESTSTGTTITYTSVAFGTANASRILAVGIWSKQTADTDTVSSVTIGGVSATQVSGARASSTGHNAVSDIWYAAVPTGTSGNIVVTWSASSGRSGIGVYNIVTATATPTNGANAAGNGAYPGLTQTLTVPGSGKGFAIFGVQQGNAGEDVAWTNAISDYSADAIGTFATVSTATVAATASVNGNTLNGSSSDAMSMASWRP